MKIINIICFLLLPFALLAQEDFPKKTGDAVNDFADMLSSQEEAILGQKLVNYYDTTGTQIVVVTITSLGAYDAMDYAIRLGEEWGVGGAEFSNGILILVAKDEKRLAIATGYGLEGAIPDAATFQIREDYMQPYFKEGEFYTGLDKGTDVMIALAQGEYTAENIPSRRGDGGGIGIGAIIFFGFILWTIIQGSRANKYRKGAYGRKRKMDFWTAMFLGSMLSGGGRGSSWSDFNSGGGSFGGGGGSFGGGFGGGSFGGGGSAGSW